MKSETYECNSYYQGLLQNFYAGAQGCFSAFMQFFYQYNQSVSSCQEHVECFQNLYENELQNCQILSQILIEMGGENKYFSSSRKFLSGHNVNYIKDFKQMFLADVELLELNIIELKNMIEKIENEKIREKLKIILENKKSSLKILKQRFFENNLIKEEK